MTRVTMKQAISNAKTFVVEQGGFSESLLTLREVSEKNNRWVIKFDHFIGGIIEVEISKEDEEIMSFRRLSS